MSPLILFCSYLLKIIVLGHAVILSACKNSEGGEDLSNQKWTNCEIEYDQFCCSDCTKSLCLEIKNKMSAL